MNNNGGGQSVSREDLRNTYISSLSVFKQKANESGAFFELYFVNLYKNFLSDDVLKKVAFLEAYLIIEKSFNLSSELNELIKKDLAITPTHIREIFSTENLSSIKVFPDDVDHLGVIFNYKLYRQLISKATIDEKEMIENIEFFFELMTYKNFHSSSIAEIFIELEAKAESQYVNRIYVKIGEFISSLVNSEINKEEIYEKIYESLKQYFKDNLFHFTSRQQESSKSVYGILFAEHYLFMSKKTIVECAFNIIAAVFVDRGDQSLEFSLNMAQIMISACQAPYASMLEAEDIGSRSVDEGPSSLGSVSSKRSLATFQFASEEREDIKIDAHQEEVEGGVDPNTIEERGRPAKRRKTASDESSGNEEGTSAAEQNFQLN